MSNSNTLLDQISSTQANKEVVVNALLDAASPATLWGRHASACAGLTWGFYGGYFASQAIANGTVTLTASTTNYLYADNVTGAVSVNTTGVPVGKIPLYQIVTGATTVTSYLDQRSYAPGQLGIPSGTVTDVAAMGGMQTAAGTDVVTTGTIRGCIIPNVITAPRTFVDTDRGQAFLMNSATAQTQPMVKPSGTNFQNGWFVEIGNIGAGPLTVSVPNGALLDGVLNGTVNVPQFACVTVYTDGNTTTPNYYTQRGATSSIFDAISYLDGKPNGSQVMLSALIPQAVTFPVGLAGSFATSSGSNATASTVFTINRIRAGVTTALGTITFAAGASTGTFSFATAQTLLAGDILQVIAPATADASLSNVNIALVGTR